MGCTIAHIEPIRKLIASLSLPELCHSRSNSGCLHSLSPALNGALGISGAVIGYCQALFQNSNNSMEHSTKVTGLLQTLPWSHSQEIFYGYRNNLESPSGFIQGALSPFKETGRIPVLITGLIIGKDDGEIKKLFSSERFHSSSETMLIRLLISDEENSLIKTVELMAMMVEEAKIKKEYPSYWPLLQFKERGTNSEIALKLKENLGELFQFTNFAINPFTNVNLVEVLKDNITVAQLPIGSLEGINDSNITLPAKMNITGKLTGKDENYSLLEFLEVVNMLKDWPTIILLGPTLPEWNDHYNYKRIEKFINVLTPKMKKYWDWVPEDRKDAILELSY